MRPRVVCTLGNFATRLLRGGPEGIGELHGRDEVIVAGGITLRLLPLYHPAAALYTRTLLERLQADIARLPELIARPAPVPAGPDGGMQGPAAGSDDPQLGLF